MLGSQEMILIFIVVILLFGATKLPELARSMGKSVGEFKRAQQESELEMKKLNVQDAENSNKQAK
jgi:sec-independent protein translocase protein TatA